MIFELGDLTLQIQTIFWTWTNLIPFWLDQGSIVLPSSEEVIGELDDKEPPLGPRKWLSALKWRNLEFSIVFSVENYPGPIFFGLWSRLNAALLKGATACVGPGPARLQSPSEWSKSTLFSLQYILLQFLLRLKCIWSNYRITVWLSCNFAREAKGKWYVCCREDSFKWKFQLPCLYFVVSPLPFLSFFSFCSFLLPSSLSYIWFFCFRTDNCRLWNRPIASLQ